MLEIWEKISAKGFKCGRFGQFNFCQMLYKLAQSSINRQIWSHCSGVGVLQADRIPNEVLLLQ